jgi:peptide/nickel transport system substrate-binding protein
MEKKRLSRRQFLRGAALSVGAAAVAACAAPPADQQATPVDPGAGDPVAPEAPPTTGEQPAASPDQLPRNETLYVAGFQWGPPSTFNPFSSDPAWPASGTHMQIYETLFAFNQLTGGLDPLLGQEVTFSDDNLTATITLHEGTTWQDGQPLTSEDVVYTYNLANTYQDLPFSTLFDYVTTVNAVDERTIEVQLNPQQLNPGLVNNFFTSIKIIPQHIWSEREAGGSISQVQEMDPVGSGPYRLMSSEEARIALVRHDNYWGNAVFGTPGPRYVVHPVFESNDSGNLAFSRGEVDFSQQFVPQIWQMSERGAPVGTWFEGEPYYVPGSIPIMIINVQRPGLDNPEVRRALAYAINYPLIAQTAMSRYSAPANSSLIIPQGGEEQYFDEQQVNDIGWEYNPDRSREILENELGATRGNDGFYTLQDGTRLGPWTIRTPYGWTDWMTACDIVAQDARQAGFDISPEFPEAPVVTSRIQNGDFDLNLWYIAGMTPAAPWQRFRDVLDDRGVPPQGQTAFWNYGRFSHPEVPGLLDQAAASTDEGELADLFSQLDRIFIENVVAVPLMYRPLEFYEFNETHWTGFPTEANPTAPPMHSGAGIQVYYQIRPVN